MAETAKLRLIVDADTQSAEDATKRLAGGMDKVETEAKAAAKATDKLEKETDQLGKEAKQTTKELDKQKKATAGMTSSLKGAVAGFAVGLVSVQAFKAALIGSVQASFEHERAMRATAFALENTGEIANISVKSMDAWAESLQQATGVSSDFILRSTNLAITMGATSERAQQMTTAALDFAAATGRDASQAVNQLVKTLGGYAGELAEILPQVKQLTAAQLKAGGAADVMAQLVGGAALDMRQTAAGSFQVLQTDIEDLKQSIGEVTVALVPKGAQGESIFQQWSRDLQDFLRGIDELNGEGVGSALALLTPTGAIVAGRGRGARVEEGVADVTDRLQRLHTEPPGTQGLPGAPFAPGQFLDVSDPGQRYNNLLDELKLLQSREEDPIAIFRELARAYSPEEAARLANVTKTLTEAIALRTRAEEQAKTAAEGAAFAGPTQADFTRQTQQDDLEAQFMDFAGPSAGTITELTEEYNESLRKQAALIDDIGETREDYLKREHSEIVALSTTIGSMFIDGIRGARDLGDTLDSIFTAVIDSLAEQAARKLGFEIAAFAVSFIPGVGPIAAQGVSAYGDATAEGSRTGAPNDRESAGGGFTDKQLTRSMARLLLPEQRKADARGL